MNLYLLILLIVIELCEIKMIKYLHLSSVLFTNQGQHKLECYLEIVLINIIKDKNILQNNF